MKKLFFYIVFLVPFCLEAQDDDSKFIIGFNIGGYAPNKSTAAIFKGDVTAYNIHNQFGTYGYYDIINKPILNTYFSTTEYTIYETASFERTHYQIGFDMGIHLGSRTKNGELFVDYNFASISFRDYFTVEIFDPTINGDYRYEQIPISGKEKRTNINLGYSVDLYNKDNIIIGFPFFAQLTDTELKENYYVVGNDRIFLNHSINNSLSNSQNNPGGIGFGGGAGLTATLKFNEYFSFLAGYYAQYSKINLIPDDSLTDYSHSNVAVPINPWGLHHSVFVRIIWKGTK